MQNSFKANYVDNIHYIYVLLYFKTFATAPKKHNENVIGDTDVKDKVLAKHLRDAGNSAFW